MRPSVALPIPISNAPGSAAACGAADQAVAVPWPPTKAMLPMNSPRAAGWPNACATSTPAPFCSVMTATMATQMTSAVRPAVSNWPR